jgi:hypothetical protein
VQIATAIVALAGWVVALPVYLWHRRDLQSFRRPLWAGYGRRQARLNGALVCYLALGWPELLMALGWRTGRTRAEMIGERDRMREAMRDHRAPDTDGVA